MTREEAKDFLPLIKAFSEGKEIQYYDSMKKEWGAMVSNSLSFSANPKKYRIKPEHKVKPFKEYKDVFNAIKEHGNLLTHKNIGNIYTITFVNEKFNCVYLGTSNREYSYENLVNMTFLDGTPFGIKE